MVNDTVKGIISAIAADIVAVKETTAAAREAGKRIDADEVHGDAWKLNEKAKIVEHLNDRLAELHAYIDMEVTYLRDELNRSEKYGN